MAGWGEPASAGRRDTSRSSQEISSPSSDALDRGDSYVAKARGASGSAYQLTVISRSGTKG